MFNALGFNRNQLFNILFPGAVEPWKMFSSTAPFKGKMSIKN